ncbi:spore maturation protein [Candidatus Legionella polyplacis]|uniref:spore maturation protein n=1 Tax=Candidatus Legionella polyplacis TaxID=2005262 RepID=UPI000C1E0684|nr:nucleoside recognition domain-containing protein [Candidatus Legionella polyplacis]ATW01970.1 spore maturation protein [Candidatus Legionella polyplacis]
MFIDLSKFFSFLFVFFFIFVFVYAAFVKINVFDVFVSGAKDGFSTSIVLVPYLVAMIVAVGMLRSSGFFEIIEKILHPVLFKLGIPSSLLPLILIRPFSGSASIGIMAELMHEYGGNSDIAKMAAIMMGSTETTFYIITTYFGIIGIKNTRYTVLVGLLADFFGIVSSIIIFHFFLRS